MTKAREEYESEILSALKLKIRDSNPVKKSLTLDHHLKNNLGFDSLDGVELTQDLEDQYSVKIPDSVATSFQTGRDIVSYLVDPQGYMTDKKINPSS